MQVLAIETSCDETSVAVVKNGTKVLSCVTATSVALHAATGGIIPENAARKQVEYIIPTLEEALKKAFPELDPTPHALMASIDAIAVTVGPGLIGSLLVGIETAKTLSCIFNKPLIPVNHLKAHIYSTFLAPTPYTLDSLPSFPLVALIVSGGHTDFVFMKHHGSYEWLGGTRDDAAGECFDKCARLLGLPYPGGPSISKSASVYKSKVINYKLNLFPRPMAHDDNYDVSFSGLKTSVKNYLATHPNEDKQMLAAEVEEAIVDTLTTKIVKIAKDIQPKSVVVCGGVSANIRLKEATTALLSIEVPHASIHIPEPKYGTDNAAMVGAYAFFNPSKANWNEVNPNPELHF